jgi:dihydroorotase
LPVLKRSAHRRALIAAATSGDPRFFLGTDSAPHPLKAKLSDCGCAGIYTAHAALELYAEVFEAAGALDRLESFAGINGARFYGLPLTEQRVQLSKRPWTVPSTLAVGRGSLVPFRAGESCTWRFDS